MAHLLKSVQRANLALLVFFLTARAFAQAPNDPYANPAQDPPNRVARIAVAEGNVSFEPAGTDSFAGAEVNYPLTNGDRLYADLSSVAELQTSGLAVRLGNGADLTITVLNDAAAQFALAQGSIRLRTRDLYAPPDPDGQPQQAVVEVDTPNTTVTVEQPGDMRVDYYPGDGATVVTVNSGVAQASGPGFNQTIGPNQSIRLVGFQGIYPEYVQLLPPDELDRFDASREQMRLNSVAYRNHYVDPDMIGVADLDQYGAWQPTPEYGPVWFPQNVAYGWTPYSVGHWANVYPWGYTWVDAQPWGFAPFHYGRWNNFGGRWGWVPGPPPSVFRGSDWGGHPPRPVYSPALVAFVGGGGFSVSLGGVGVAAWFPLGPSEPYVPWYRTTPAYVNRVNVTNLYTTNVTQVHNTYVNKTVTVYNVTNVTYVNRTVATVAVNQRDFAAGRSVAQSAPVRLDAKTRQQLTAAPVLTRPVPPPPRMAVPSQVAPRALPPSAARPVVQTRDGFQRAGAPPAAIPLRAPTPPPASPAIRAAMPQQRPTQTIQTIAPARPNPGINQPVRTPAPAPIERAAPQPEPRPQYHVEPIQPVQAPRPQPAPRPEQHPEQHPEQRQEFHPQPSPAPVPNHPVLRPQAEPTRQPAPAPPAPPNKTPPPPKQEKPKEDKPS